MNPETCARLCDPALLQAREEPFAWLKALFAGRPAERAFALWGRGGGSPVDPSQEPERWLDGALDDLAAHAAEALDPPTFRPLVIEFGPYGVRFIELRDDQVIYLNSTETDRRARPGDHRRPAAGAVHGAGEGRGGSEGHVAGLSRPCRVCHCERSEAIANLLEPASPPVGDCFASLAMTDATLTG